jgi:ATP-dependent Clp protease ATP-binding subunit ClpA
MLKDHFRPEFLNRIDEIVVFESLSKETLASIVELQLEQVSKRLSRKRISITFTNAVKAYMAKKGYDPAYGARPLKRAIQELILDDLALKIISGDIVEGDEAELDAKNGTIIISKKRKNKTRQQASLKR